MLKSSKFTISFIAFIVLVSASVAAVSRTALVYSNCIDKDNLQAGDVVFIEGQSSQAPYIKFGTMNRWSHCGIVVDTPEGLKVLEASKIVRLVPFEKFVSWSKDGNFCVRRPKDKIDGTIKFEKYLGMPYDLEFKFNNGKMYCSELVWLIYKENGIELCKPRKVSDYPLAGVPKVKKLIDKRNIAMDQEVVAPSDLFNALKLSLMP